METEYPKYFIINPKSTSPNLNKGIDYWIVLNKFGDTKSICESSSKKSNAVVVNRYYNSWGIWVNQGIVIEIPAAELALMI